MGDFVTSGALGSTISAAGSVLGAVIGAKSAQKQNREQIQYSKEAADLAWKRQLELRAKDNAYNSAAAQVQRLRAAGLSPQLMYGGSGGSAAGSAGSTSVPMANNPNMVNESEALMSGLSSGASAIGSAINASMANAQRRTLEQGIQVQKQDILLKKQQVNGLALDNEMKATANKYYDEYQREVLNNLKSDTDLKTNNALKADAERRWAEAKIDTEILTQDEITSRLAINAQTLENLKAQGVLLKDEHEINWQRIRNLEAERNKIIMETFFVQEQAVTEKHKRANLDASTYALNTQAKLTEEETKRVQLLEEQIGVEIGLKKKEAKWYGFNQVIGAIGTVAGAAADVYSMFNPAVGAAKAVGSSIWTPTSTSFDPNNRSFGRTNYGTGGLIY